MISAVVCTKDEQQNINRCLRSLSWCDEIILVDDNSTDRTTALAKRFGAKIFEHSLNNDFAAQHNFGLEKASGEWVLFVDADEEVPEQLQEEVLQGIAKNENDGFYFRRRDHFLGRWLAHGEISQVCLLRLAKKTAGIWKREVHETWQVTGRIGTFKIPLNHYSHPSIKNFIDVINMYTSIDARHMFEKDNLKFSLPRVFLNPIGKFLQNYFLRLGFLDGYPGFVMAFMMSFHSLVVRVKMYEYEKVSLSNHDLSQTSSAAR